MTTHLIVGDPHATPTRSNERFEWLGRLALDRRPEVIVCMGDFADMPSLCSYDRGTKDFEGRRYVRDVAACRDALNRFEIPIAEYNSSRAKNKKAQYKPKKIMLGGNHDEGRISRVVSMHPELDGSLSIDDLGYTDFGWQYIPFRQVHVEDGIAYSHYFPSGVKGEAISGLNVAQNLLAKTMFSVVVGHNHLLDFAMRTDPTGKRRIAVSAGWFSDEPQTYAAHTQYMWWQGAIFANNVVDGEFDVETIKLETLKDIYDG